jgi:hypothetical protein
MATATVYVLTRFIDVDGSHEVGEQIQLPKDTPEDEVSLQNLLSYGIVTTRKPSSDQTVNS